MLKQEFFSKALKAMEFKNYDSTIYWMQRLLEQEQDCLEARQLARRAALERWKKREATATSVQRLLRNFFKIKSFLIVTKARYLFQRGDFSKAFVVLESLLGNFPHDEAAHRLMVECAMKWSPPLRSVALFSYEALLQEISNNNPRKMKLLEEIGAFCLCSDESGLPWNPTRAKDCYEEILLLEPHHLVARKGMNRASAALSVATFNTEPKLN
ncbi:MAG: hypothetical protein A3F67_09545 [Verrucomicrobia bacterium RIFCSPHIGHO2_12_FULL_41_10]|nr:MAG: hypothetical protein A3F67_09545 [Verrucomicrobia bacterium RIFCSPHIGHO2_12_FULL_41_10]